MKSETFEMEAPESIRNSLQTGKWVTSIDVNDAYFHIAINPQSRKYLHFHIQSQSYQIKALPSGLSTAPVEFTMVIKEVKLMAANKGMRIHQYLDDWLVIATYHQICTTSEWARSDPPWNVGRRSNLKIQELLATPYY